MLTGRLLYRYTLAMMVVFFIACKRGDKKKIGKTAESDTCVARGDGAYFLDFQTDTSTTDFHAMLKYLVKKGEVSIDRVRIDTVTDNNNDAFVVLTKRFCPELKFKSPEERWYFKGVFSMSADLVLSPKAQNKKDLYRYLGLVQYNFATEKEKEYVYKKMKEIGWDVEEWPGYELVEGEKKVYLIYSPLESDTSFQHRYADIIKKEWASKY